MTKIYIVCPDCQCFAEFIMVLYFYTRASVQKQRYDFFKFLYCCFSGMLTGKFKKDVVPDAGSSRAGYLASLKREGKSNMSYYEGIANEDRFWKLLDVMEDTAKIHGRYASQSINNDQSTNLVCSHNALRSMV